MHLFVESCLCPDQDQTHSLGISGRCSNQLSYPDRAPLLMRSQEGGHRKREKEFLIIFNSVELRMLGWGMAGYGGGNGSVRETGQHLKPHLTVRQRGNWKSKGKEPPPQSDQPFPWSCMWYGRGILCQCIISISECAVPVLGVSMVLNCKRNSFNSHSNTMRQDLLFFWKSTDAEIQAQRG